MAKRKKCNWLLHVLRRNDDSSAKQYDSGQWTPQGHNEESDHRRPSKIWKKCEQQVLGTVVGRWRQQHKTQLDGEK